MSLPAAPQLGHALQLLPEDLEPRLTQDKLRALMTIVSLEGDKASGLHGTSAELWRRFNMDQAPDLLRILAERLARFAPAQLHSLGGLSACGILSDRPGVSVLYAYALARVAAERQPGSVPVTAAELFARRWTRGVPTSQALHALWRQQKLTLAQKELMRKAGAYVSDNWLDYSQTWDQLAPAQEQPAL